MTCLLDIKPLDCLEAVGNRYGVTFWIFGGVATRAAIEWRNRKARTPADQEPLDLFRLTPFTADVDLTHDGNASQTPAIHASLLESVTAGEAFRWQLSSDSERHEEYEARRCNNIIPARLLSLSSVPNSDFVDPWNGLSDIRSNEFRYIRNGFYAESPLYKGGRDLEIFSALLYIQTLFEAGSGVAQSSKLGFDAAQAVFDEAANSLSVTDALRRSAYLRARLVYLLRNAATAAQDYSDWSYCMDDMHLGHALDALNAAVPAFGGALTTTLDVRRVIVSAASVGADRRRIQADTDPWLRGEDAVREAEILLANPAPFAPAGAFRPPLQFEDEQFVVLTSPILLLTPGNAPSSTQAPGYVHEFMHFDMRLPLNVTLSEPRAVVTQERLTMSDEEDFSAVLAVSVRFITNAVARASFGAWHFFSLPTVVSIRPFEDDGEKTKLQIRINCLNILEEAAPAPPGTLLGTVQFGPTPPASLQGETEAAVRLILLRLRK